MGKASLIILFIFLNYSFFAQLNQVDAKGKKQGEWQKAYPNSKALEYKGTFKDDKPIGTFYYFYASTKTKAVIVHNEKTGRSSAKMYHETGVLMTEGIYKNQKKDSVWSSYGPSGRISFKETFKEGKLNGKKTIFYVPEEIEDKSQRVAVIENYLNDILHGEKTEYFEDGSVKSTCRYENGKKIGKYTQNHINGQPMIVENFKYGTLHGWCLGYDESGKVLGKRYYKKGVELKGKELDKWIKYCKEKKINPNE
ncbi:MAG: hypothetical protein V4622_02085 [Bacteroidota bacterium]